MSKERFNADPGSATRPRQSYGSLHLHFVQNSLPRIHFFQKKGKHRQMQLAGSRSTSGKKPARAGLSFSGDAGESSIGDVQMQLQKIDRGD